MKSYLWLIPLVLSLGQSPLAKAAESGQEKKRKTTTLRLAMRDGLRFDPPRLKANPGDRIELALENADSTHQVHNLVLVRPGQLAPVVQASMEMGAAGPEKQFVPELPAVIAGSSLLGPDQRETLSFTLPDEPGVYPFVCTFPGHGMVMYGALYAGVEMPALHEDPNLPAMLTRGLITGGGKRPYVQRVFMPGASPAAIAVALPGTLNYCWDATVCRLRYVWNGDFIDASEHWRGNGDALARVPTAPWWTGPQEGATIRFGAPDADPPPLVFGGYRTVESLPEFRYQAGSARVNERLFPGPDQRSLSIRYRIVDAPGQVFLPLPPASGVTWKSSAGLIESDRLVLTPEEAREFILTLSASHAP